MTQSLGARATSLAASAGLLGIVVFAAFSVSIQLGQDRVVEGDIFESFEELQPEPPTVLPRDPPLQQHQRQDDAAPETLTPLAFDPIPEPPAAGPITYDPQPALITNPRWLRQPQSLASYYPRRALARDMPGQVLLDCLVDTSGALSCSVISETPANWGFGEAALRIAQDHRMVPATRDGQAVQGRYRMRVPFELD